MEFFESIGLEGFYFFVYIKCHYNGPIYEKPKKMNEDFQYIPFEPGQLSRDNQDFSKKIFIHSFIFKQKKSDFVGKIN